MEDTSSAERRKSIGDPNQVSIKASGKMHVSRWYIEGLYSVQNGESGANSRLVGNKQYGIGNNFPHTSHDLAFNHLLQTSWPPSPYIAIGEEAACPQFHPTACM
jgi:hypothetical protein